jgi:hypothetical protein
MGQLPFHHSGKGFVGLDSLEVVQSSEGVFVVDVPLVLADLTARHERVCRSVIQLVPYRNPPKSPFACF